MTNKKRKKRKQSNNYFSNIRNVKVLPILLVVHLRNYLFSAQVDIELDFYCNINKLPNVLRRKSTATHFRQNGCQVPLANLNS